MIESPGISPLLALAGIGLLAPVAQWAAWRVRLPAILFLLIFGILVGPVAGLLDPDALFGDLLFPIISLSVAVILFEGALTLKLSELKEHESGLLAVTLFGMIVANQRGVDVDDILDFKESLSLLLISGLFIVLAARIDLAGFVAVGWTSMLVVAGIILIARPISVFVSSIGSDLSLSEKTIIAWIGPRGIVCAAVAAIFALRLEQEGAPGANLLVLLAFLVIISTVVLQRVTAKPLAGFLGVRDPAASGYLIIGGGRVARMIAQTLAVNDVRVVIADSDWDHISQARMDGIETYFGNPISDHADRYLDLSGIGNLISLSGRAIFDVLTAMHYRREFGSEHLYELRLLRKVNKMVSTESASACGVNTCLERT